MDASIYNNWKSICTHIVTNKVTNWKQYPHVREILEHVSQKFANIYLQNLIQNPMLGDDIPSRIKQITILAQLNDTYGSPEVSDFVDVSTIPMTPSSIRYIAHACDICAQLLKLKDSNINIIEVGAGYGGLYLILFHLIKKLNIPLDKYIIYDLPEIQKLQQYYLSNFNIPSPLYYDSSTFAADLDTNGFLISNYCLSEIIIEYRLKYLHNLLPRLTGGYMIWNTESLIGLPVDDCVIMDETPNTGGHNRVILYKSVG